jgi:parvulin-like peptidyl-prolyl isomerase
MEMRKFMVVAGMVIAGSIVTYGCAKKEKPVAIVGNIVVTDAEVKRILDRKMNLLGQTKPSEKDRRDTLNAVICNKLLYAEGLRLGLKSEELELNAETARIRGKFRDEASFRGALKAEGLSAGDFRKEIGESVVVRKVEERLGAGIKADEEESRKYYRDNAKEFFIAERFKVYLVLVTQEDNARHLLLKLQQSPESFDRMALEQVEPELQQINRKAALTAKNDFPDDMQPLLGKMPVGAIGGPVKTKRGYYLFRLIDRKPAHQKSWDETRVDILHLLTQEKRQAVVRQWLAEQRKKVKVQIL